MKHIYLWFLSLLACTAGAAEATSPAHEAAKHFLHGVNLANYLEVPPSQTWVVQHSAADLTLIRAEGFDHVRLPVCWQYYTGPAPEYNIAGVIFAKVDNMVNNATSQGLAVIIDFHGFTEFTHDPSTNTAKFYAIWRQVAAHYAKMPATVAFELLNEPNDAATTAVMNPIYAEAIAEIRQTNPQRTIFVDPGKWSVAAELANLQLPDKDRNLIVSMHCYEPFYFTHQGASWAGPDVKLTGIRFPGPPPVTLVPPANLALSQNALDWILRYNTLLADQNSCSIKPFRDAVQTAKAWSQANGRPVHFGEFGCIIKADPDSRANYYTAARETLDDAGIGWAVWDWKSGFRYYDAIMKKPSLGLHDALFPKPAKDK